MGGLSDFKKRVEHDKLAAQRRIEEVEKKRRLIMKNDPQLRSFREKQFPLFKAILADFAKDIDYIFREEKPDHNCLGQFRLYVKVREGFWGHLFPRKGGWEMFKFGVVATDDNGNLSGITAVAVYDPMADNNPSERLQNMPENLQEAKDWFNDFLYKLHKPR